MSQLAESTVSLLNIQNSALGQSWTLRECDERVALAICQKHDLPDILGRMLAGRGVTLETVETFLAPTLKTYLPDPSVLLDMDVAAERLAAAVMAGETIGIFGDYDVDGATSSAVLIRYFSALGINTLVHIPDRITEGYGPNAPALLGLMQRGAGVVITVDCGTVAFAPLEAAFEAGLDVIVVDHHIGEAMRPKALAVVNPNRADEGGALRQLAAVGVCFLLLVAISRVLRKAGWFTSHPEPSLLDLLDLVALGTVCDVVPLTGLNRALVCQGLKIMAERRNPGLKMLMDLAGMDEKPGTYHLGFVLGPRINAGGRVGKSDLGVRLLTLENESEIQEIALQLNALNSERRAIEALVLEEAFALAEAEAHQPMIIVGSANWHPGVIGIVAGRLKERYHRPVAVLHFSGGVGKASARSISGIDLGAVVTLARQAGLLLNGGGHAMAAGFSVAEQGMEPLKAFFCNYLSKPVSELGQQRRLTVDGCLSPGGITTALAHRLEQIGPYGMAHPHPRFVLSHVRLAAVDTVGENHLRLIVTDGAARLKAMAFRAAGTPLGDFLLSARTPVHLAGQLRLNYWQGRESVDFHVDDAAA